MDIADIYEGLLAKLGTVQELKWIDQDFGQMESDQRPAVQFPCALIGLDLPQTANIDSKTQRCQASINIRLAFNPMGQTANGTPASRRATALQYYSIVKKVYNTLQGDRLGSLVSPMRRVSQVETARHDQIKIVDVTFRTDFVEK